MTIKSYPHHTLIIIIRTLLHTLKGQFNYLLAQNHAQLNPSELLQTPAELAKENTTVSENILIGIIAR